MQLPNESVQRESRDRRLLFYTHALVGGGAERVWAQTASGLFERGYTVEFCVDWDAHENEHLLHPRMTVHRLGRNHALGAWRLGRLLARRNYSVVFSAVGASNLKSLAAKVLGLTKAKSVLSQHGHYEAESRFLGRLGYRLTPLTSRLSAATIVVSDALREDLIKRFWASPARVRRIYNGIELAPPPAVASAVGLHARADVILAIGRLVPEKGHMDLLRALTMLPRTTSLTIAGDGPERSRLEAAVAEFGLSGRVSFVGYLKDLSQVFQCAKVLALPSHTEAFGNVVVEALGFGVPVVSTDCGGPSEILQNGQFGALTPVGDAAAMAKALAHALREPGDPSVWRARAEEFSVNKIMDEYEALLDTVLEPSRSRL